MPRTGLMKSLMAPCDKGPCEKAQGAPIKKKTTAEVEWIEVAHQELAAAEEILVGADGAVQCGGSSSSRGSPGKESASSRRSEAMVAENPNLSLVWVHIYHTDPYTAWLNWAGLKYAEVPIYHAGVEVYGREWAFQYFDDAWDDDTISGVTSCTPRQMLGFDYQESVNLGETKLSMVQVREVLDKLREEWPACSYHITRHNCLSFAQRFIELLRVPERFPEFLLGFGDGPRYIPITDAVVDYGWGWYKWGVQASCQRQCSVVHSAMTGQPEALRHPGARDEDAEEIVSSFDIMPPAAPGPMRAMAWSGQRPREGGDRIFSDTKKTYL